MSGDHWKDCERRCAQLLGGERLVRGNDFSASEPDVVHPRVVVDCKSYKQHAVVGAWRAAEERFGEILEPSEVLVLRIGAGLICVTGSVGARLIAADAGGICWQDVRQLDRRAQGRKAVSLYASCLRKYEGMLDGRIFALFLHERNRRGDWFVLPDSVLPT